MTEFLTLEGNELYALSAALLVIVLVLWFVYRRLRRRTPSVEQVIRTISFDYLSNLILPKADEGEIHIDHLLLTAEGILVIDMKDAQGIVFGSDKMQNWTVIASDRRYTFSNPQPGMFDRIAAVRQIVRQVPVTGRILFMEGAEFTKGVPDLVAKLADLVSDFGEADSVSAAAKIDAFKPHWEQLKSVCRPAERRRGRGRRSQAV